MKDNRKDYSKSPIRILISYFRPHMGLFALDLSCALIACIIDLTFPLVARKAMYSMLPSEQYETFFRVMVIVAIAFVLRVLMNYVITYWGHMFGVRVEADLREDLFKHMQKLDFEFFDKNRTGQLMNRLTGDLFEITELAHHGPEDLFISIVTIAGSICIMFAIKWQLALAILIIIPVFIVIVMLCKRKMVITSRDVKMKMAEINGEIESGISGVRVSKAFGNEETDYNKFKDANEKYKTAKCRYYSAFGQFNASVEYFMCIMPVVILSFGGLLIMKDDMNYKDLITFYLYIATFIMPVRKMGVFMEIFMNGYAGMTRFTELMRVEPSIKDGEDSIELSDIRGNISFEDVSFSYIENAEILEGINLDIKEGETIAVVGPTGGGKTTLCQLIPRFYDCTGGRVLIDGIDVKDVSLKSLRDSVGIVQQDVFLFPDSVLENIRYGNRDAADEAVYEAAKKAEIFDDIMAMPEGMNTNVGDRGIKLSGGQKQRISIARVFLKNPQVLILDEATSALDTMTESKIQGAFDRLSEGRTTIVIAHRLSTIRNADRIILIDNGRIVESGTHDELIESNSQYASLYNIGG